jgi:lipoyl(octanoyl) transferase
MLYCYSMNPLIIRRLGLQSYSNIWQKMHDFTQSRSEETADELWLLEHYPVFTQGLAGKAEHILNPGQIPVIQSDRGGQVTYHGPGQLVAYPLLDLNRSHLSVRGLVTHLEECLIQTLAQFGITAHSPSDTRGVYIDQSKIASIGLRVKRGCSLHGVALNVNMDLTPFSCINPCGFQGLKMVQMCDYALEVNCEQVYSVFTAVFLRLFGYTEK